MACRGSKSEHVRGYTRAAAPKRKRRITRAPASAYWECRSTGGRWCGVHHSSQVTSLRHAKQLDKVERRKGSRTRWDAEKRGG